jgi:hypothetical protein
MPTDTDENVHTFRFNIFTSLLYIAFFFLVMSALAGFCVRVAVDVYRWLG